MDVISYLLGKKSSGGSGGSGLDWNALGFNGTPKIIIDDYNYSKNIYDNWQPATSLRQKFFNDVNLKYMPAVDTSTADTMYSMFSGCNNLLEVCLFDTSKVTNMNGMFQSCWALKSVPLFDTSNVSDMQAMFRYCNKLVDVPQFDTTNVTGLSNMFTDCRVLSDKSLDNILKMCINAKSYYRTKTLSAIGFSSSYQPASKIESLPSYQDFINAGWTIGY